MSLVERTQLCTTEAVSQALGEGVGCENPNCRFAHSIPEANAAVDSASRIMNGWFYHRLSTAHLTGTIAGQYGGRMMMSKRGPYWSLPHKGYMALFQHHFLPEAIKAVQAVKAQIFVENIASRRMLERAGFREVGIYLRHAQLEGTWRDVVIVEKRIAEISQ